MLDKYSKGKLKMGQLTYEGFVTRGMRVCVGADAAFAGARLAAEAGGV